MKIYNRQAVFFFLLFCLLISQCVFADDKKTLPFIVITDIHFDPFITCGNRKPCPLVSKLIGASPQKWPLILSQYDQGFSRTGQDTNWPLLVSSLRVAGQQASINRAQFVLILGDFLGHEYHRKFREYAKDNSANNYQLFIRKTLQFLTDMLTTTFPNLAIYPVLGNNDSYHGDYFVQPKGSFFEDVAKIWSVLIKNNSMRKPFLSGMRYAGFYALNLNENVKLIMLNSTLFSDQAKGPNISQAAKKEIQWFKEQLQKAKENKQKVLIGMHIPMRIDLYAASKWRLFTVMSLWNPDYIEEFQDLLAENAANISGILAGHLHSNWNQMLSFNDNSKIPLSVTASISPIFGNNPTFSLYNYLPLQKNKDYYLTMTPNPKWHVERLVAFDVNWP